MRANRNFIVTQLVRVAQAIMLAILFLGASAYAAGPIPSVINGGSGPLYETPQAACQGQLDTGMRTLNPSPSMIFQEMVIRSSVHSSYVDGAPPYNTVGLDGWHCHAKYLFVPSWDPSHPYEVLEGWVWMYPVCDPSNTVGSYSLASGDDTCPGYPSYYADTDDGGGDDDKKVGDPINASSGNMYRSEVDVRGELSFVRTYNSLQGGSRLGPQWTHNYNRAVQILMAPAPPKFGMVVAGGGGGSSSGQSTKKQTAELACTAGFAELQPRVANWAGATATYANDTCSISKSGQFLAAMNLFFSWSKSPPDRPFPIGYQLYREDGTTIRLNGGALAPALPPGTGLRFLKTPTGFAVFDENDTVEIYDSAGRLTSIVSRTGYTQTLTYAGLAGISTITDSFGKTLTFSYDAQNRLSGITDGGSHTTSYGYDAQNRLNLVTFPDLTTHAYRYESTEYPNGLTGFVDANNVLVTSWTYDSKGRATSTTSAGGANPTTMVYNENGTVTHTDESGAVRTYTFDKVGSRNLITGTTGVPCPTCGDGKSATYDNLGWPTSRTDYSNRVTQYVYDPNRGLETSRTEAFGTPRARTITTTWHPSFRLPTQINEPGRRTTFTHDSSGNVLTSTVTDTATSNSRTWTYVYGSFGQLLSANGPRTDVNDITNYTYNNCTTGYGCGHLATVVNALGHTTTFDSYNSAGQPLSITDANGVVTTLTYDSRQRLTSHMVNGEHTGVDYWPIDRVKKVTLPDDSFVTFAYDNAHRLIEMQDSEGNRLAYTLNSAGKRTKVEYFDPSNSLTSTQSSVFNQLGQLHQIITAANTPAVTTTLGYDNNGNFASVNAPLGRNASSQFDEFDRLANSTDPIGGVTTYGYNSLDQLVSVTDPRNLQTTYAYNALGDILQQRSPDTGNTTNNFDENGNVKTWTDMRGSTGTFSYDSLNRVTLEAYSDESISHVYDAAAYGVGKPSSVSDASGTTSWTYASSGRIESKTQVMGTISKTVSYSYNAAGRLQSILTPSGKAISYSYVNDKISGVQVNGIPIVSNVKYEPFGPLNGWTWGNGSLAVRVFDIDGRVTHIDSAGLNSYNYDDAFRVTGISDVGNASNSLTFGYDAADRLLSGAKSGQNQTFTYDANGNRLSQGGTTNSSFTNSIASNRLTGVSGALVRAYSYDEAGNTSSDGVATYTYTSVGRMHTATRAGVTTTYAYNALGQRVRKSSSVGTTYFTYDETGRFLGEYDATGALVQEIVWLNDTPIATIRWGSCGMAIFYIHTDHLNTPRKITKRSTPDIVWRWDSDAFGTTPANENPSGIGTFSFNLRFAGQYWDKETGNIYNGFRTYSAETGRFLESDPIGIAGGVNTYSYVINNPISFVDPSGLDWIEYTGESITYYGGSAGDRSNSVQQCQATSGQNSEKGNYQYPKYAGRNNEGPVPPGFYTINLVPSHARIATVVALDYTTPGLKPSTEGGIEKIPQYRTPDGVYHNLGYWGTWRARLDPKPGTTKRNDLYLHDSNKGRTHGCVETCDEMRQRMVMYRKSGAEFIDVWINYTDPTTNGGKRKY